MCCIVCWFQVVWWESRQQNEAKRVWGGMMCEEWGGVMLCEGWRWLWMWGVEMRMWCVDVRGGGDDVMCGCEVVCICGIMRWYVRESLNQVNYSYNTFLWRGIYKVLLTVGGACPPEIFWFFNGVLWCNFRVKWWELDVTNFHFARVIFLLCSESLRSFIGKAKLRDGEDSRIP